MLILYKIMKVYIYIYYYFKQENYSYSKELSGWDKIELNELE